MKFRIKEILEQKGKTRYWLYMQLGLSYQNFNKIINNQTKRECHQITVQLLIWRHSHI